MFKLALDAPGGWVGSRDFLGSLFEDVGNGFFAFSYFPLQLVEMVLNVRHGDLRAVVGGESQT